MAMITDIFAASPSEFDTFVQRRDEDPELDPLDEFRGVSLREITLFEFDSLLALLAPGGSQQKKREDFEPATDPEDEEGLILRFPHFVVERLGTASADQLTHFSAEWAKAEGFLTIGWSAKKVHSTLKAIAKVAKQAKAADHDLFMVPGM